jgi:hypothetical protein
MTGYPKYSRLVLPSIQQLWQHEAPLNGRTTMSSESMYQVAHSWVDVGSFHMRLFMILMVFTVSVRNILDLPSYVLEIKFISNIFIVFSMLFNAYCSSAF